jgi:diaminohydroxyphosphoribosylaminopyrimidine deaminase/5-amino-6-(5-phosphoribosylamino)uracil reductase
MDHKFYMQRALDLAKLGLGTVHPNPMVGAVIIKDGRIIGEGFHEVYGGPHAEINALANATEDVTGATMYVTLEPCSHTGKTPPCADAIIASGINEVVIAMQDPNPLVSGRGIERMKDAGIHVQTGVLKKQAKELNQRFLHFIQTKRPYVVVKSALSKNNKITSSKGPWVTGEDSRKEVHEMRRCAKAVMVGIGTVLADDPMLTVRHVETTVQPIRIILDSKGQTPVSAKRLAEFLEKGIDACRNDEEKRNWQRNEKLVDFHAIPEDIKQTIWDLYLNNSPKGDKQSVMNYLIANRCRMLLDELEEF